MTEMGGTLGSLLAHPVRALASLIPTLLAAALVMLVNFPVSITGGLLPAPAFALAAVYYWTLVRPDLMPMVAVLLIGILEDLLSGGPQGLWTAGFLAAYVFADRQRDTLAGLAGIGTILGFGVAMGLAGATAYGLVSLVYWRLTPLSPLLMESIVTVLLYPLVAVSMGWVYKKFIGPVRVRQ